MASLGDKIKAFSMKITGQEPEPETLPQQLLRQVDEATTLTWKQVSWGSGWWCRMWAPRLSDAGQTQGSCAKSVSCVSHARSTLCLPETTLLKQLHYSCS